MERELTDHATLCSRLESSQIRAGAMLSFFADVLLLFFSQPEARSESTVARALLHGCLRLALQVDVLLGGQSTLAFKAKWHQGVCYYFKNMSTGGGGRPGGTAHSWSGGCVQRQCRAPEKTLYGCLHTSCGAWTSSKVHRQVSSNPCPHSWYSLSTFLYSPRTTSRGACNRFHLHNSKP